MNKAIRNIEAQVARIRKTVKSVTPVKVARSSVQVTPVYVAGKREEVMYQAFSAREHESFQAMGELMLRTGR